MPRIEPIAEPSDEERKAILAPLDAFSRKAGHVWKPEGIALVLRDDDGTIVGGVLGETDWGWLRIAILAVDERLRGQDWGTRLMDEAERIAVARGCHHAWVDTFSFQARPFYERLGYRVFGELADYPKGETRYFLAKPLVGPVEAGRVPSPPEGFGP